MRIGYLLMDDELEILLTLDGASFEAGVGHIVEFTVRRTERTPARPSGISYALVFRPRDGEPYVRFDNAHPVGQVGGRFARAPRTFDHWHRSQGDQGRPYAFTTAMQLLEDFWREVKRVMAEKGIPNDL
jgi:Family of unknown function (DUF6516)